MVKATWTTGELAAEAAHGGRPVTAEYIRQLCRAGAILAERPARDWLIPDRAAQTFLKRWLAGETMSK